MKIRYINRRLRSMKDLRHKPTQWGKGKWESIRTLWAYKRKNRRKKQIAKASRRRNRNEC